MPTTPTITQREYTTITLETAGGTTITQTFSDISPNSSTSDLKDAVDNCNLLLADSSATGFKNTWYSDKPDDLDNYSSNTAITRILKVEGITKTEAKEIVYEVT